MRSNRNRAPETQLESAVCWRAIDGESISRDRMLAEARRSDFGQYPTRN